MENPKNTLMSMPCTRLLRYTLADQCAYGRDWKKPTIFYNNSCYGLPLKLCPHPKGFKHAKALGGPNMKSAWNKKRIKSAIPLKLATDISAAVTDVHFKMRTCDATRTRQKQLTAEAMAIMVNALQNQGPTQPLKQRYVDTVDMAAGGTAQVLQEEDSISQAETEEIEVMDLTIEKQGVHQSEKLEAEDGQPTTVIKNKKSREWFPSWQYEHQLKHMDATAKDARTLRAELIQARDAAQREEVKLECTITCLLCQAKIKAEACQRHIMKRFCDACWSSNHTRCKQMLKRIRHLGQHEQRAQDYKRIGNRTSSTYAMPEEKRKDKEEDISFRSARDVWKARLRSTKERRERDRQRDRKRVKALQETSRKHTKSTAVIIDKPEEEANNKKTSGELKLLLNGQQWIFLVDSGTSVSTLTEGSLAILRQHTEFTIEKLEEPYNVTQASGEQVEVTKVIRDAKIELVAGPQRVILPDMTIQIIPGPADVFLAGLDVVCERLQVTPLEEQVRASIKKHHHH